MISSLRSPAPRSAHEIAPSGMFASAVLISLPVEDTGIRLEFRFISR
jgi:hypothetical protein